MSTDDGKLRNEIPGKLIADLPTAVAGNMRSPFDLANLTAGVQGSDTDVRVAGGQQGAWGATLDGGSITGNRYGSAIWSGVNSPSLDAIDQFVVGRRTGLVRWSRSSPSQEPITFMATRTSSCAITISTRADFLPRVSRSSPQFSRAERERSAGQDVFAVG